MNFQKKTFFTGEIWFFCIVFHSLIWGNIGFFIIIRGSDSISTVQRYWIVGFLLVLAIFGTILVVLLKRKQAQAAILDSTFATWVLSFFTDRLIDWLIWLIDWLIDWFFSERSTEALWIQSVSLGDLSKPNFWFAFVFWLLLARSNEFFFHFFHFFL